MFAFWNGSYKKKSTILELLHVTVYKNERRKNEQNNTLNVCAFQCGCSRFAQPKPNQLSPTKISYVPIEQAPRI